MIQMNVEELLQKGVETKRRGDYTGAIKIYQQCMIPWLKQGKNPYSLMMSFGKAFLLSKNKDMAKFAYGAAFYSVLNLQMGKSFYQYLKGIRTPSIENGFQQFMINYRNLAYHIGAIFILDHHPDYQEDYKQYLNSISGAGNYVPTDNDQNFMNECIKIGFHVLINLFDEDTTEEDLNKKLISLFKMIQSYKV